MFKQMLQSKGYTGKTVAQVMPWFNRDGKHPEVGYASQDPKVIHNQVSVMKAIGIDAVVCTYSGAANSGPSHLATLEMGLECERQGLQFGLLMNGSMTSAAADKTAECIKQMTNPETQYLLQLSNALPYVLDFGTAADPIAVSKILPFPILQKHTGYTWPEKPDQKTTLSVQAADWARTPKPKMATLTLSFDDGGMAMDRNRSVWDSTKPATVLVSSAGNFFFDQLALVPKDTPYVGVVWNDYQESNAFEPWAAMLTGIRIS